MTLALAMLCKDGFVMCADQQITVEGSHKFLAEKLEMVVGKIGTWEVIFGFADSFSLYTEVKQKVTEALYKQEKEANVGVEEEENAAELSAEDIYGTIEGVLEKMGRTYTQLPLSMFFGISPRFGMPALLIFQDSALHEAEMTEGFYALGNGHTPLTQYLKENLYSRKLTTRQVENLGIYIIANARKYVEGVGGPIEVVSVSPTVNWLKREDIEQREKQMFSASLKSIIEF